MSENKIRANLVFDFEPRAKKKIIITVKSGSEII